jgi:hypothetical protein
MVASKSFSAMELVKAEPPTPREQFEGLEYAHLKHAQQDGSDGAWWCSECNRENVITHYQGCHPFGKMDCVWCGHVVCSSCLRTDILQILNTPARKEHTVPSFRGAPRYGSVCSHCGLTHRATEPVSAKVKRWFSSKTNAVVTQISFSADCPCGTNSTSDWIRFRIGSNKD